MSTATQGPAVSKPILWGGRILSGLVVLLMAFSGGMKLTQNATAVEGLQKLGYPEGVALWLGIAEVSSALLYAIPQTSVLGAILLTGFLGGATATHVRMSEPFFAPIIVGVVVWLGLWLRDPRVRALTPWRT